MKSLVIRTGINTYRYLVRKMKKGLTPDALLTITQGNYTDYVDRVSHRPMFSKHFLLEIYYESESQYLEFIQNALASKWVQCVIYVSNKEAYEQLQKVLAKYDILFYDSYQAPDSVLLDYIQKSLYEQSDGKLKASLDVAKYIRRRVRFQEFLLDSKLEYLARTDLSKAAIDKAIPKYRGVKLATLPYHFFKAEKKREVASFLVRYKNNIDIVYKPIIKFVDTWLEMYDFYLTGELNETNYLAWMESHGRTFQIKYDYQMQRWLELLSLYSYEKVLTIRMLLESESGHSNYKKTVLLTKLLRSAQYEQHRSILE